jgi:hypothetical protein
MTIIIEPTTYRCETCDNQELRSVGVYVKNSKNKVYKRIIICPSCIEKISQEIEYLKGQDYLSFIK